jgi:hypothetical protein
MRVGKPANKVFDLKLASLATASARTIKTAHNPASATARFLLLLGDGLQSAPRPEPRQPATPRKPPARQR